LLNLQTGNISRVPVSNPNFQPKGLLFVPNP